ncbi:hypothetical protein LTR84_000485 [Exophiala bonariae]|uniref:Xylanolytic transcriptional activator regulatory domain-containing protein n=1 Tax=Exophiala bonariae TaxID=1690606 RepID=A0AAV9NRT1_9EURO|nr:hypothetical protein LTR84_000485 [Exophiala bonariae]
MKTADFPERAAPNEEFDGQDSPHTTSGRKAKRRKVAEDERKRAVRACDGCRIKSEPTPQDGGTSILSPSPAYQPAELKDRARLLERILRHKLPGLDLDTANLRRVADTLVDTSSNKSTTSEAEGEGPVLADDDVEIRPVEGNVTHYSGEFSYWNFSQRIKRHVEDWMGSGNPDAPNSERVSEFWRAEPLLSSSHSLSAALACCPPRDIAEFLVHVFFRHAESNYFYVDRAWLLDILNVFYTTPNKLVPQDAGKVSIALAIFAIGTQYAYLESLNPSGASTLGGMSFSEDEVGTMFFEQAAKLLPEVIQISSLESVQACLLLGLYCLPLDASGLAYTYFNLAMKIAIVNGMHRKYLGRAVDEITIETKNRVWWTLYVVEKKIGIFHGRPTSVLRSDVDADLPTDRVDMIHVSSTSNIPHMVASVHLLHKLEDFFKEMQLLRKCQKSELQSILSRLITMKDSLAKWYENLPHAVHSQAGSIRSTSSRPRMHLKLEYCLVRMFVGRPFLFSRHAAGSTPNSTSRKDSNATTATGVVETDKKSSRRASLIDDCVQAAQEAISVCRMLRDGIGLARASYIEYSSCRASLLVLIAYCIYNQTNRFREPLQTGLSMIREMSASGASARAEVSLIEALERAQARLQFFTTTSKSPDTASPDVSGAVSGYDRFKNWQAMLKGGGAAAATNAPSHRMQNTSMPVSVKETDINPSFRQHHMPHHWSIDSGSENGGGIPNFAIPNSDTDLNGGLGPLHSAAESAFFGLDSMMMSSNETVHHPERQVLQDFLAIPDFEFNLGFDHGTNGGMGRMGARGFDDGAGFAQGSGGNLGHHW